MAQTEKVIQPKPGLLEFARQLGNVSKACKSWAKVATASIDSRSYTIPEASWRCRSCLGGVPIRRTELARTLSTQWWSSRWSRPPDRKRWPVRFASARLKLKIVGITPSVWRRECSPGREPDDTRRTH